MLSTGAFNALLKTLEEPPSYVIFILATTEAHKIPITILSRCQRYDFKRIGIDTIQARLQELVQQENVQVEEKALRYIAKTADGSLRDALSLLDQCIAFYLGQELTYDRALEVLGAVDTSVYSRMFRCVAEYHAVGCLELIDQMMVSGRDLTQFINEFVWYLRNLLLIGTSEQGSELVDVSSEQMVQMQEESKMLSPDELIRYIHILSELSNQIRYAVQKRVMVEVAMIKLCRPQMDSRQDLTTITQRLAAIEKQLEEGILPSQTVILAAPSNEEEKTQAAQVPKNYPKAVPEDIKEVIRNWSQICSEVGRVEAIGLERATKTVGEDGALILQFTDPVDEGLFRQDEGKRLEELRLIIQNATRKDIRIQTRVVTEQENSQFPDIEGLINCDNLEIIE